MVRTIRSSSKPQCAHVPVTRNDVINSRIAEWLKWFEQKKNRMNFGSLYFAFPSRKITPIGFFAKRLFSTGTVVSLPYPPKCMNLKRFSQTHTTALSTCFGALFLTMNFEFAQQNQIHTKSEKKRARQTMKWQARRKNCHEEFSRFA